ncbi:TorD/DmsD family molecular chaperone [Raoultibacter phocaeensis]|uniref:TorD/DmsD family molecular chaperone n=1 Tax=Raoultibacter phocaeensis TaxID=2479841 RepID=UPI001118AEC2|nr:molecular chaperone TorD family protein [Raoultibacter phocaeensis]
MKVEMSIREAVGRADMCELLARTFAYPDDELAYAVVSGSCVDDLLSCLADAGCEDVSDIGSPVSSHSEAQEMLSCLRKEYTKLYLNPAGVLIYPYESAFIHMKSGHSGKPILFRTPITLDVETQMRDAGIVPKNALKEPCDSVYQEFEFLSFLYGSLALAIQQEDFESSKAWSERIERFLSDHVLHWIPQFMEDTIRISSGSVYGSFARFVIGFLACLGSDAHYVRSSV